MNAETAALAEFVRAIVRICDTHDRYRPQPPTWNDDGSVNPNDVETFIRELSPSVDELHHAALRECTRNNTVSVLCPKLDAMLQDVHRMQEAFDPAEVDSTNLRRMAGELQPWMTVDSEGKAIPKKLEGPVSIARTVSGSVLLFSPIDQPIVKGNKQPTLTKARYEVVLALLKAGNKGLTKDELDRESGHGDARRVLKRLSNANSDWESVISFPGSTGKGYRII